MREPGGQLDMFMAVRQVGDRVELAPHLHLGDRLGTVTSIGRFYLHVCLDSGKTVRVVPENVKEINP